MATILITGTSGFLGRQLAEELAGSHRIVGLSRKLTEAPGAVGVSGDFSAAADLRKLDGYRFDVAIHLAAVTGGSTDAEGLQTNVLGSFTLLRYLLDHGCRKFVLASSIAAVGLQSTDFRPLQLPIPDEHPCLDRDGYGFSKYMMEEVTRFLSRQTPEADFMNLRLASIVPDAPKIEPMATGPIPAWTLGHITKMYAADAVRCLRLAAAATPKPGVRVMNAVAEDASVAGTIPELLRTWYGADVAGLDLSHYERAGHERDSVYSTDRIFQELGFRATTRGARAGAV